MRNGSGGMDPELESIFKDPDLLDLARRLTAVAAPEGRPDPAFRSSLRRDLMREAWSLKETRLPWWRRLTGPVAISWAAATVGVILLAVAALNFYRGPGTQDHTVVLVNSPLANVQSAQLQRSIPLTFSQPMNHASVESSIRIQPATSVSYKWSGDTLYVKPQGGNLAPNTHYQVRVEPTAQTATGKQVAAAKTISFVTAPAPAPTASPSPTPPAGPRLGPARRVISVSDADQTAWSKDSSTLLVGSQDGIRSVGVDGSSPVSLTSSPTDRMALSPDGSALISSGSAGVDLVGTSNGRPATILSSTPAVAVGWQGQDALWVQGSSVYRLPSALKAGALTSLVPLAYLPAAATEASFSPDGTKLLYSAGGVTHLLVIASGQDTTWSQPGSRYAWSQDGKRVAYLGKPGIMAGSPNGAGPVKLAAVAASAGPGTVATSGTKDLPQLAWSDQGQVLIATGQGLWQAAADGSHLDQLAQGSFGAVAWAPDASGVSYFQGGSILIAPVTGRAALLTAGAQVVNGFLGARLASQPSQAAQYLDPTAKAAYGPQLGAFGTLHPSRAFILLGQPQGSDQRYVARIVLARGKVEVSQFDEVLTLTPQPGGGFLIDQVKDQPTAAVGNGPTVVGVRAFRQQVEVWFDSDLNPATVSGQVTLDGADGNPVPSTVSYSDRVVTLDVATLEPGTSYTLVVATGLTDVNELSVSAPYTLGVLGPSALSPLSTSGGAVQPTPSPSPSPSTTPSPSPSPSP